MKAADIVRSRGHVVPSFVDIATGRRIPWDGRHNTISFDATHAMALAFGGDSSLIPNKIGIIYGSTQSTDFATVGRSQSWTDLIHEMQEKNADVQVQAFSHSPSFLPITRGGSSSGVGSGSGESPAQEAESSSSTQYPGWAVTFHAHSDSCTPGAAGTASSGSMIFTTWMYIFQAVLLNETRGKYTILARVSLANNGVYYTKPENFELALDWTIKFF